MEKNTSKIYCPQCGGKNFFDAPDVKFCRFCGLSLLESRDAVQGFSLIKQNGLRFASWGYIVLQILFLVMILFLVPNLQWWVSAVLMLIFAISNGFFIAGSLAAREPARYAPKRQAKNIRGENPNEPESGASFRAVTGNTENPTRNLSERADQGNRRTTKLL